MNLRPIALRPLLAITVNVEPPVDLGDGRRVIPFSGGTFTGPDGVSGVLTEGGADWQQQRADGTLEIDAHYTLRSDDLDYIEVRSTGLRCASGEVTARLGRGEAVEADEYYFRTHVRLFTTAPRLARLNDILCVSTGQRDRDRVLIHVHEVL
ncbi:MAG TPA: DUF3237 domain-containing protein [Mycobacteriales bacterium]|nr:DUF3237 domain-containing protein [Mycobacteriales bacterium]